MTTFQLETHEERQIGYALADKLWGILCDLNRHDILSLVLDRPDHPDSVYHHIHQSFRAVLRQLGLTEDESWSAASHIYDGASAEEAVRYMKEQR